MHQCSEDYPNSGYKNKVLFNAILHHLLSGMTADAIYSVLSCAISCAPPFLIPEEVWFDG